MVSDRSYHPSAISADKIQDLLQLGLQDLRRAIAMIPQEPVLFQDR